MPGEDIIGKEEIVHSRTGENSSYTNIKEAKGKHAVKETWKEGSKRRMKQEQCSQTWGGKYFKEREMVFNVKYC